MKKITFFILALISINCFAQFPENFGGGSTPLGWSIFDNGNGTTQSWIYSANGYMLVQWEDVATGQAEDWLATPQFTVGPTNTILTFDTTDYYSTDYLSTLSVKISTASQTTIGDYANLLTISESDIVVHASFQEFTLDLSAYIGQNVYIAFVMTNDDGDAWFLDNVDLVANASAPNPVTTPTPADGAVNVYIDPTDTNADMTPDNAVAFAWVPAVTGDAATSYDFYLGDSPITLNYLGNTSNTSVNVTGMQYSTLYYWQIVARNVGGEAVGSSTWSFTTESDPLSVDEFEARQLKHFYDTNSNILTISSNYINLENIRVFNVIGQQVINITSNNSSQLIDLSNLKNGIYIVNVSIENRIETFKFIKQ